MPNPLDTNQYLIPLLTQGTQIDPLYYDPEQFLSEYGMYLPEYDETEEIYAGKEQDILTQNILKKSYDEINKAQVGYGKMGNINAYYGGMDTLYSSVESQLNIGNIKALEKKKGIQSDYLRDYYRGLGTAASYGAFDPESPGTSEEYLTTEQMGELYPDYFGLISEESTNNAEPGQTGWINTEGTAFENYDFGTSGTGNPYETNMWGIMEDSDAPVGSEGATPYTQMYGTMTSDVQEAYEECLDSSSIAEQEFCFNFFQEQSNEIDTIVSNMMLCEPGSPYYNETECMGFASDLPDEPGEEAEQPPGGPGVGMDWYCASIGLTWDPDSMECV